MVAANHTFIHEMIQAAGFQNAFQHKTRYPEISLEELKELDVDLIFLSSEPYPFKDKHFEEFKPFCQQAVIKIVDGELFSWYGSRLLYSVDYFKELRREFIK
jgi:ABC-type Fe3+-hydroxamate transport system substrate-binding protein